MSEVSDDLSDEPEPEKKKEIDELPEVGLLDRKDPRYADHLDDSLEILEDLIGGKVARIKEIRAGYKQTVSFPDNHFVSRDEAVSRLEDEIREVDKRVGIFTEEALRLVRLRSLYDPDIPSRYVHFFVDMHDSSLAYARLDLKTHKVEQWEDRSRADARELFGMEWVQELSGAEAKEPYYLVACDVSMVDFVDLVQRASVIMDIYMSKRFPDFYREQGIAIPQPSVVMGVEVLAGEGDDEGEISLTPMATLEATPYDGMVITPKIIEKHISGQSPEASQN